MFKFAHFYVDAVAGGDWLSLQLSLEKAIAFLVQGNLGVNLKNDEL